MPHNSIIYTLDSVIHLSDGEVRLRAAMYSRVSTEDQAKEGFSIAAQIKRLDAYCKARGWDPAGRYVDDGFSGREVNRPAYQRMMVERDDWDVLIVLKMDRIHRNSKNFTFMMENLREWGKEFNSMQENFDTTTAMGRFVMDIIQRIAQLESEQIGERVRMGMAAKARKGGGPLGSPAPYGYRYVKGRLESVDEESMILKRLFESYLKGMNLRNIADSLNAEGIRSKRGGSWSKQAISKMLKNPIYCGFIRWDGIVRRGGHEPVVTVEDFNRVQELMDGGIRNTRRAGEHIKLEAGEGDVSA